MKPTPWNLIREISKLSFRAKLQLVFGRRIRLFPDNELEAKLVCGASFVRWGDGETALIRSKSIGYQEANIELKLKLLQLLELDSPTLILGVPWSFYSTFFDRRWTKRTFKVMFSSRVMLLQTRNVGNRFLGRTEFFWDKGDRLKDLISRICASKKIALITSDFSFLDLCPNGTFLIPAPRRDAYSNYDSICKTLREWIQNGGECEKVVLCAIGPTSKAIAVDFYSEVQVVDVGHGFRFSKYGSGNWAWVNAE